MKTKYWTQAQVARVLGTTRQWIGQLIRRRRNPIPFENDVNGRPLFVRDHNLVTWLQFEKETKRLNFDFDNAIEQIFETNTDFKKMEKLRKVL